MCVCVCVFMFAFPQYVRSDNDGHRFALLCFSFLCLALVFLIIEKKEVIVVHMMTH